MAFLPNVLCVLQCPIGCKVRNITRCARNICISCSALISSNNNSQVDSSGALRPDMTNGMNNSFLFSKLNENDSSKLFGVFVQTDSSNEILCAYTYNAKLRTLWAERMFALIWVILNGEREFTTHIHIHFAGCESACASNRNSHVNALNNGSTILPSHSQAIAHRIKIHFWSHRNSVMMMTIQPLQHDRRPI